MEIFNNTTNVVRDELAKKIAKSSRVFITAACFSNYDLVVIDESHSFRSGGAATEL